MTHSKEYMRKWRHEHPKQCKEHQRKWRKEHPEQIQKYYREHREHELERMKKYRQEYREKIFAKLGNKCVKCGFSDPRVLQIDHVHGHGIKECRGIGSNSTKFYKKVLADTKGNYQILCANCNWIKRHENREER
jgi:hypothetical protein